MRSKEGVENPMKITPRLLSIPPYISTAWKNVSSLFVRERQIGQVLVVSLLDGSQVEIPNLAKEEIDAIFQAHAELSTWESSIPRNLLDGSFSFNLPIKTDGSMLESIGSQMQHNPEQSDLPPIPPHVLEKIKVILRSLGLEDASVLEKAESNCNCIYCQLARSLQEEPEEVVEESELKFRDWEVSQKEEKLYHVVNPLDKNEYYDVYLGDPIGCTCGTKNCEHIRAVLNT